MQHGLDDCGVVHVNVQRFDDYQINERPALSFKIKDMIHAAKYSSFVPGL